MAKIVKVNEGMSAEPATDGWHDGVLAEVVDLGVQASRFTKGKKTEHQGILMFQVEEVYDGDGELAGKRKEVRLFFDFTLGLGSSKKGTKLRKALAEWRGKDFSAEQLQKFATEGLDLDQLVGQACRILTASEKAKTSDKEYAKPIKFAPAGDVKLKVVDYTPYDQRDDREKAGGGGHDDDAGGDDGPSSESEQLPWDKM